MRRYKDAFTPVPQETVARVEDTLRHLPHKEARAALPIRRRWAVALVAALVLTLCGGAVAAERLGVLSFLFGSTGSPTAEQQQLVQNVNLSHKADMATITVTDAIFDGRSLSMGLAFDTDKPTYARAEGLWLNGTLVPDNDISARLYWLNLTEERKLTTSGLTAVSNETITGQIEVRLRVMLLQPCKALRIIDANHDDWEAQVKAARLAVEEGYTPLSANEHDFASLDMPYAPRYDTETDYPYHRHSLSTAEMYNMDVEKVWLTFTLEASSDYRGETIHLDVANNDDLPFTVVVRRAEMTLIGSHFVLDIYPKAGRLERPADLERIVSLSERFYNDEAIEILFQSTSVNYGYSGWMMDDEGNTFYRWVEEQGPLEELPEKLYLVFDSAPSFKPLWQWAIELCPADAPDTQDIPPAQTAGLPPSFALPFYHHYSDAVVQGDTIRCEASLSSLDGTSDYQELWRKWEVCDLAGNRLEMGAGQTSIDETDDGGELFVIKQSVAMPEEIPDAVYMIPVNPDTDEANWDYAIMLPVARD